MSRVPKHSASHAQHAPPLVTKHAPPSCPPAQSSQSFLQPGTGGACRAAGGGGPAARLGQQAADERERGRVVLGAQVQHGQARLDALPQECALLRARPLHLLLAHLQLRRGPFGAAKAIAGWRARARVCPWLAARARSRRQVPAGLQHALLQAQARGWTRTCAGANTSCAAYMCHAQVCNAASCLLLGLGQLNSMAAGAPRRSASSPAAYWCASRSVLSSMKSVGTLTEARRAEQSAVGSQRP